MVRMALKKKRRHIKGRPCSAQVSPVAQRHRGQPAQRLACHRYSLWPVSTLSDFCELQVLKPLAPSDEPILRISPPFLGLPIDCNRGESRHQALKRDMASSCKRTGDILRHLARKTNVALAAQYLRYGLRYEVQTYRRSSGWTKVEVEATQDCKDALGAIAHILPLNPAPKRDHVSRPRRTTEWQSRVIPGAASGDVTCPEGGTETWRTHVKRFAPRETDLVRAYRTWFGCPGVDSPEEPCGSTRCPRCWDNPGHLVSTEIACHNFYVPTTSIEDLRADGIRGADVKKLGQEQEDDFVLLGASAGDDVQFRRDAGQGSRRPVARILYFFEHKANATGGGEASGGETTTWAVVLEFKSAGIGMELVHDNVTDMAIFSLQRTPHIFPAEEISHVIHMAHQCRKSGPSACSVSAGGVPTWKHVYHGNRNFILNGNFARREG